MKWGEEAEGRTFQLAQMANSEWSQWNMIMILSLIE